MGLILRLLSALKSTPPHESAYGIQLTDIEDFSNSVRQILSLEILDPRKTKLHASLIGKSGGIEVLTKYCARLAKRNPRLEPLAGVYL